MCDDYLKMKILLFLELLMFFLLKSIQVRVPLALQELEGEYFMLYHLLYFPVDFPILLIISAS